MDDTSTLLWGLLFGSIGAGYFIYGKKQKKTIVLIAGIGLCATPYLITNLWLMIILNMALMALPYFMD